MDAATASGRRRLGGLEWMGNSLGSDAPDPRLSFDHTTPSDHFAQTLGSFDLTESYQDIVERSLSSSSSCNPAYTNFTGADVSGPSLFEDSYQMAASFGPQEQSLLALQDPSWHNLPQAMFALSPPLSTVNRDRCGPPLSVPALTTSTASARDADENLGERASIKTRHRRQNRSCDPCRASKRGCDLPRGVTVRDGRAVAPCTSCNNRELSCTVSWLARRKLVRNDECLDALDGSGRADAAHEHVDKSIGASLSMEVDLPRKVMAETTCSEKFNEYVCISDSFLSQCLLRESMPLQYRFGVAAYDNLSKLTDISSHVQRAEKWAASCWNGCVAADAAPGLASGPRILQVAGLLDALFMSAVAGSPRDAAITEAFKWVGIATAAQLSLHKTNEGQDNGEASWKHGVAVFAWQKARGLVFANISATSSFRLALALAFFGNIAPPVTAAASGMEEEYTDDRDFALCEGIKRLCTLCCKAREEIKVRRAGGLSKKTMHMLPDKALKLVMELIGSLEWLACILNSVTISTTLGRLLPFHPDADDRQPETPATSPTASDSMIGRRGDGTAIILAVALPQMSQEELEGPILGRARRRATSFCDFCRANTCNDDAVLEAGRLPMALSVLSWIFLARFTLAANAMDGETPSKVTYEHIRRHYLTMNTFIGVWRTAFGTVDHAMRSYLQKSPSDIWRMFSFCTVDTDFAILLFCDAAQRLEKRLNELQHVPEQEELAHVLQTTRSFRTEQRLTSAGQIAVVTSTCQDPKPTGHLISSQGGQTQNRDILAHPCPWMMVQVHALAVQVFSEEINKSIAVRLHDVKYTSTLTAGLNTCLQGLRGLQDRLCTPGV